MLSRTKQKGIPNVKILDPACGSGSFLVAAFDKVLEAVGKQPTLFTRYEILQENVFGIDIDAQAVEIARLNLLLKLLSQRNRLPLLQHNILKENSLTAEDGGKYDVVIGNPPYIKQFVNNAAFDGLQGRPYYQGKMDIWTLFACQAIDRLKDGGYFSFIAPNNWITNFGASIFRDKILAEGELVKFIDFGEYKVFKEAGIQTMIFIFQKKVPRRSYPVAYAKIMDKDMAEMEVAAWLHSDFQNKTGENKTISFTASLTPKKIIGKKIVFVDSQTAYLLAKIQRKRNFNLTEKEVAQGIVGDPDKAFIFPRGKKYGQKERKVLFEYYTSVNRNHAGERRGLIAYLNKDVSDIETCPTIRDQLLLYKAKLKRRREVKNGRIEWFHLHWPRDRRFFEVGPKIVSAIRTARPSCFYTEEEYYGSRALNFIKTDRINQKFLVAVLNSKLACFWLKKNGKQLGDLLQVDKGPLLDFPIVKPADTRQEEIAADIDAILGLNRSIHQSTPHTDKWNELNGKILKAQAKLDGKINTLYGLTEPEIKAIESISLGEPWRAENPSA